MTSVFSLVINIIPRTINIVPIRIGIVIFSSMNIIAVILAKRGVVPIIGVALLTPIYWTLV